MTQTTTINVDISKPNIPVVIYAKQHDIDTRKVEVSLYDNGSEYTVPASVSGQVNVGKPDGTGCYYDVDSISGNKVTFTLVEQTLTAYGEAIVDVSLISTEDDEIIERLTSFSFRLIIEKRAIEDSSIISSDYYNALIDLAGTVQRSVTFAPYVSSNGDISWTNNGGLTNPETVNIKGEQGYSISSVYVKTISTDDGGTSTYGVKNSNNVEVGTFSVKNGSKGSTGSQGATGPQGPSGVKMTTPFSGGSYYPETKCINLIDITTTDSSQKAYYTPLYASSDSSSVGIVTSIVHKPANVSFVVLNGTALSGSASINTSSEEIFIILSYLYNSNADHRYMIIK